jgi:hypothetical protein
LGPEESKEVSVEFPLSPLLEPTSDKITAEISIDDYSFDVKEKEFETIDYTEDFTQVLDEDRSTFKTIKTFVLTNDGNLPKTQIFSVEMPTFASWFTSTDPAAEKSDSDRRGKVFSWEVSLEPTESTMIQVVTNYKGFAYTVEVIAVIIAVLIILYFIYRSPLKVRKEVDNIQRKEGGISEFKVLLHVKNLKDHVVKDLEVVDYVPNLIDVVKEFSVGTLSPTKILKHQKKGKSMISWKIEQLEPNEERIISYNIKSKLTILGDFALPTAMVKYTHKNKRLKVHSNAARVAQEEEQKSQ